MKRALLAAAILFPLAAQAHEEKAVPRAAAEGASRMAVIREAPDFRLVDTAGRPVRLSGLRGRPVLVAFVYTTCTSACPLLTFRMARLQEKLDAAGSRAVLVSVSVDPERDDAATLAAYARRFGAGPGWHFVREAPERLQPVLEAYEEWTRRLPSGEVDHPARLHLVDGAGRVREIYSLAFFDEEQAFLDIAALERERGRLKVP